MLTKISRSKKGASLLLIFSLALFFAVILLLFISPQINPDNSIGVKQYNILFTNEEAEAAQVYIAHAMDYAAEIARTKLFKQAGLYQEIPESGVVLPPPCGTHMYISYSAKGRNCTPQFSYNYKSYFGDVLAQFFSGYKAVRLQFPYSLQLLQKKDSAETRIQGRANQQVKIPLRFNNNKEVEKVNLGKKGLYTLLGGYGNERIVSCATGECVAEIANLYYDAYTKNGFSLPYVWGGESPYTYSDTLALQKKNSNSFFKDVELSVYQPNRYTYTEPGFDCSGWVWWVGKHADIDLLSKRVTADELRNKAKGVATLVCGEDKEPCLLQTILDKAEPGDILYKAESPTDKVTHTMIYVGKGVIIHSKGSTGLIKEEIPSSYVTNDFTTIVAVYRYPYNSSGFANLSEYKKSRQTQATQFQTMDDKDRLQLIVELSEKTGIQPELALAILRVETGGLPGFCDNGKMLVRFEPQIFGDSQRQTEYGYTAPWSAPTTAEMKSKWELLGYSHGGTCDTNYLDWDAFTAAQQINENGAYESTSYGMGQIMGFNYDKLGYKSAKEMYEAFSQSEEAQIRGVFSFIQSNKGLLNAAQHNDFNTFAKYYNGEPQPCTRQSCYATKIEQYYDEYITKGLFWESVGVGYTNSSVLAAANSYVSFTPYMETKTNLDLFALEQIPDFISELQNACSDNLEECVPQFVSTFMKKIEDNPLTKGRINITYEDESNALGLSVVDNIWSCVDNNQDNCLCTIPIDFTQHTPTNNLILEFQKDGRVQEIHPIPGLSSGVVFDLPSLPADVSKIYDTVHTKDTSTKVDLYISKKSDATGSTDSSPTITSSAGTNPSTTTTNGLTLDAIKKAADNLPQLQQIEMSSSSTNVPAANKQTIIKSTNPGSTTDNMYRIKGDTWTDSWSPTNMDPSLRISRLALLKYSAFNKVTASNKNNKTALKKDAKGEALICDAVVNYAKEYLGTGYGGTGECSASDAQKGLCTTQCASFVTNVFKDVLHDLVIGNGNQKCTLKSSPLSQITFQDPQYLQPGDVFSSDGRSEAAKKYGHTGIYVGKGTVSQPIKNGYCYQTYTPSADGEPVFIHSVGPVCYNTLEQLTSPTGQGRNIISFCRHPKCNDPNSPPIPYFTTPLKQLQWVQYNDSLRSLQCRNNKQYFRFQAELPLMNSIVLVKEKLNFSIYLEDTTPPASVPFDAKQQVAQDQTNILFSWKDKKVTTEPIYEYKLYLSDTPKDISSLQEERIFLTSTNQSLVKTFKTTDPAYINYTNVLYTQGDAQSMTYYYLLPVDTIQTLTNIVRNKKYYYKITPVDHYENENGSANWKTFTLSDVTKEELIQAKHVVGKPLSSQGKYANILPYNGETKRGVDEKLSIEDYLIQLGLLKKSNAHTTQTSSLQKPLPSTSVNLGNSLDAAAQCTYCGENVAEFGFVESISDVPLEKQPDRCFRAPCPRDSVILPTDFASQVSYGSRPVCDAKGVCCSSPILGGSGAVLTKTLFDYTLPSLAPFTIASFQCNSGDYSVSPSQSFDITHVIPSFEKTILPKGVIHGSDIQKFQGNVFTLSSFFTYLRDGINAGRPILITQSTAGVTCDGFEGRPLLDPARCNCPSGKGYALLVVGYVPLENYYIVLDPTQDTCAGKTEIGKQLVLSDTQLAHAIEAQGGTTAVTLWTEPEVVPAAP